MAKKNEAPKGPHQGELLKTLVDWSGLNREEFAERLGKSRAWVFREFPKHQISPIIIKLVCQVFDIPENYFDGESSLPNKFGKRDSIDGLRIEQFRRENDTIRIKLIECQEKVIELQAQLLLMKK